MRRRYTLLAAIIASAVLLLDNDVSAAQETDPPEPAESTGQSSPALEVQESPDDTSAGEDGYQPEERAVGTPIDVSQDLNGSFPKRDHVLPRILPKAWFQWKEDLYEKHGVKLGFSYQAIYQHASKTTPFFGVDGNSEIAAGWALLEVKWEMYNRDKDFKGSLVATLDWRHTFTDGQDPPFWGTFEAPGSLWPTDFAYISWDPWVPVAYWEQWFKKDRFVLRFGNQILGQIYDFSRFKDPRVAFSGSLFNAAPSVNPGPGPGLAVAFEWWPVKDSPLYVVGTVNDMNFEIEKWTWDEAIKEADFFYGLEVGYNWVRGKGDFDHLHLNLSYADKPKDNPLPIFPSESGWGLKVSGEKQMGRMVGFGSYTHNSSEGGAFGATLANRATTAGLAVLRPFGLRGEIGLGSSWAQPFNEDLNSQYGLEAYWKLLLLPNLWITPGVQVIFDPTFNPQEESATISQIKARLFF